MYTEWHGQFFFFIDISSLSYNARFQMTSKAVPVYTPTSSYVTNIANIVCLFWFNNNLHNQQLSSSPANYDTLTTPSYRFKSFISSVLQQAQLSPTCLSLSLYYIYKLKFKPISANENSEYRVFTTALILSNKFLDDNTFTNSTWAKMTRLPLEEISLMEIEFLKCLKYNLVVDNAEWTSWQSQLLNWLKLAATINSPPQEPIALPPTKRKRSAEPDVCNCEHCCAHYKRQKQQTLPDQSIYLTPSTSPFIYSSIYPQQQQLPIYPPSSFYTSPPYS